MKKIFVIVLCILFPLLAGCEAFIHQYDYDDISENLTKAEIVFYERDGSISVIYKSLEYDESLNLLNDYSQLYFDAEIPLVGGPAPHYGKSIRAYYKDGSCRIFTMMGETTQSWAHCNEDEYLKIIDKYL